MKRAALSRDKAIPRGCLIALTILALMIALSGVALLWARNYFAHQYFESFYEPILLPDDATALAGVAPVGETSLAPAPRLIAPDPAPYTTVSYAVCAQMLMAQHGVDVSRAEIEFLAATTYGATSQDGGVSWLPSVDPELGLGPAAQCLGFKRLFFVSEASDAYLVGLGDMLDEGLAVRVAVDRAALMGLDAAPDAQAIVIVARKEDAFIYHDPLGDGQPAQVDQETFLAAQRSLAKAMRAPWEYNATVLIADDGAICNMEAIWRRNGQSLAGSEDGGAIRGTAVIERAAKSLLNRTTRNDAAALAESLRMMAATRADMAAYLSETYADAAAQEASAALQQTASTYLDCLALAEEGLDSDEKARSIGLALRDAATLERSAGEAMERQARE